MIMCAAFRTLCIAVLASAVYGASLDVVVVFDRTDAARPRDAEALVSVLKDGRRLAVASTVPGFRVHTALTSDAASIERAIEEAVARLYGMRRPKLYKAAADAAELFDDKAGRTRAVLFITLNREKPSDKRTSELIELYRKQAIRLDLIVLPSSAARRGSRISPPGGVICDPGPGCPPLRNEIQPDLGTLDE